MFDVVSFFSLTGAPLNEPDASTFYGDEHGYTDYPTLAKKAAVAK